jgi:hypothetical protein
LLSLDFVAVDFDSDFDSDDFDSDFESPDEAVEALLSLGPAGFAALASDEDFFG